MAKKRILISSRKVKSEKNEKLKAKKSKRQMVYRTIKILICLIKRKRLLWSIIKKNCC